MMAMERVTFRAPKRQVRALEQLVEDGEYPNKSEVIREATREFLRRNGRDPRFKDPEQTPE